MDIAEVAQRSGMAASTLRYYEKKGLIKPIGRNGLRRNYAPAVLDTLAIVSLGQSAGLSLAEIGSMFTPEGGTSIDRALLLAKAEEVEALARRLKAMGEGLRHAAACPAPSHAQCPKFQRLLKAAASGALERSLRM
jgi:DNA-binding transcriptional MerR regulator